MATNAIETTQTSATDALSKLSGKEMDTFMLTGELPEEKPKESKPAESSTPAKTEGADSSPAGIKDGTVEPAKATETPAESVPAEEEPQKPQKGAEARIKGLVAKLKAVQQKLDESEKARAVASTPAKKDEVPAKPQRTDVDEKGQLKYPTEDAYQDARDQWVRDDAVEATRKQFAKDAETARMAEQQRLVADKWLTGMALAREKYPDLDTVLKTDEKGLIQLEEIKNGIKSGSILDGWLTKREMAFDLLYYFGTHKGEVARIEAICAKDPFEATAVLRDLELKISAPKSAPPKTDDGSTPAKPAEKRVPAPATSVSGKATAPVDEIARAVAAGDTAAYFEAANREDLQKAKRA